MQYNIINYNYYAVPKKDVFFLRYLGYADE